MLVRLHGKKVARRGIGDDVGEVKGWGESRQRADNVGSYRRL